MKLPAFSILLSVAPSFSATTVVATESVKNVRGSLDEDAMKFKHARVVPDVLSKEAIETIQRNGRLGNGENDGVNRRFGEEVEDEQIPVVAGSLVSFKGNTLSHGTNGAEVRLLSPVNTQDLVSVDNIVVPREQRLLGATTNQGNKDLSPISRKLPAGPNSNACNGICTAKEAAGCEDCADPVPQSKGCDRLCGAVEFFECECGASPTDPTPNPTSQPTKKPTLMPTLKPTLKPTLVPTQSPSASPTDAPVVPPRIVFATSEVYSAGAIGSIAGADSKCQFLAGIVGRSGTFKAWLSDSTGSPAQDFVKSDVPYFNTNGDKVADDWQDLITDNGFGWLDNAIAFDEKGDSTSGFVWTGTNEYGMPDGGISSTFCDNWSSDTSGNAIIGYSGSTSTDSQWTSYTIANCDLMFSLYCFEQ